jgi:hypothetical protein
MEVLEQTSISVMGDNIPGEFSLAPNYPNPFNAATAIGYDLSQPAHVELNVYNILGQKIATLVNEFHRPGRYRVSWDAAEFASGFYFYRIEAGDNIQTRKMLLLK